MFLFPLQCYWTCFGCFLCVTCVLWCFSVCSPEMEAPYSSEEEKMRLLDLYRYMHGRIHSTSRPLKLIYHVAERETLLAWVRTLVCGCILSYCVCPTLKWFFQKIDTTLKTVNDHFIRYTWLVPGWTLSCFQNFLNFSWHSPQLSLCFAHRSQKPICFNVQIIRGGGISSFWNAHTLRHSNHFSRKCNHLYMPKCIELLTCDWLIR